MLTLTLSWGYWLTLLAHGLRVESGGAVTHFPGLLGPMFAAVAVTAVIGGRDALRELFRRMFVATEIGTGSPAAIVGAAVMLWGTIVAVRWRRRPADSPLLDPSLEQALAEGPRWQMFPAYTLATAFVLLAGFG